ncbi:MAG: AEC family transporter [Planctomycetes bacterium]|nr:AEC family transporter [Planctomycetota bacterium]
MTDWLTVFLKISSILLVILTGYYARKRGLFDENSSKLISHFVVDIAMPSLILGHMLRSVNPEMIRATWYYPLIGMSIVLLGWFVGWITQAFAGGANRKHTYSFLVAMTNWFYLPMVLVTSLTSGSEAEEAKYVILLFNLGIMLVLWTFGVWWLQGASGISRETLMGVVKNPGLIATVGGMLLSALIPEVRTIHEVTPHNAGALLLAGRVVVDALAFLGSIALPMSLVMIGVQMGGMKMEDKTPVVAVASSVVGRLVVTPLLVYGIIVLCEGWGYPLSNTAKMVTLLVAAMPVALNSSLFVTRFGGDHAFAARSVVYSTFLSLVTVPLIMMLA